MAFTVEGLHLPLKLPIDSFTPAELPDLTPQLLLNLEAAGYGPPTPLQRHTVPVAFAARDLLVMGATHGTGLTVSLLLPIVGRLALDPRAVAAQTAADGASRPRALVLAADREGATHALDVARELARRTPLRCALACGGIQLEDTLAELAAGVDVLVATAGGAIALLERGRLALDAVSILALLDADALLDGGFEGAARRLLLAEKMPPPCAAQCFRAAQFGRRAIRPMRNSACAFLSDARPLLAPRRAQRQTLVSCAALSAPLRALLGETMRADPVHVTAPAAWRAACVRPLVEQRLEFAEEGRQQPRLAEVVGKPPPGLCVVVCASRRRCEMVAFALQGEGVEALAFAHEKMKPKERHAALEPFTAARARVLVTTDAALRGLELRRVHHVVGFDMPPTMEAYADRMQCVGRAGHTGVLTTMVTDQVRRDALAELVELLRATRADVPRWAEGMARAL